MTKHEKDLRSIEIAIVIIASTILLSVYGLAQQWFILNVEELIILMLVLVVDFMNLIGGFLILFGAVLLAARYVRAKLKEPFAPFSGETTRLTFLTLGL